MQEFLNSFGPTILQAVGFSVVIVVARSKFGIRGLVTAVIGLAVIGGAYAVATTLSLEAGAVHDFERNWFFSALLQLVPTAACGYLVYQMSALGKASGAVVLAGSATFFIAVYATVMAGFVTMIVF